MMPKLPCLLIPSNHTQKKSITSYNHHLDYLVVIIIVVSTSIVATASVPTGVIIVPSFGALSLSLLGKVVVLEEVASLLHQLAGGAVSSPAGLALGVA